MTAFDASCHCGAIRFALEELPADVNDCNCSICRRYGTLWAYYPRTRVHFAPDNGPTDVYMWGERGLEFHRCRTCGCVTHWLATDLDYPSMGINSRLLAPEILSSLAIRKGDGASL